jgi:hypothetical protein
MSGAYSFMDVTASITGPGGSFALGYGQATAEEGIDIARAGDKNAMTIGADGEGMHSLRADKSGKITLRYLKTAPINAKLMALVTAQQSSSALWGKNVITVAQTASGDVTTGQACAFSKIPDLKYAKDGDIVQWVFDVIKIDSMLGTY